MMKRLKFSRFQMESVSNSRALLTIKFLDDEGNYYSWAPRWADVEQIFLKSINTEAFNKTESEWLPRFSKTVKETAEGVNQPMQNAYKRRGCFVSVREGKIVITFSEWVPISNSDDFIHVNDNEELTPLFPISFVFLNTWLSKEVEALVINGVILQLTDCESGEIYPQPEPLEADDLPF